MPLNDEQNGPWGEKIRQMLELMESRPKEERRALQLEFLDAFFEQNVKERLQDSWHDNLKTLRAGLDTKKDIESRVRHIFTHIAGVPPGSKDQPDHFAPLYDLELNTRYFGDVRPQDICELPAWKQMHSRAQAHDYTLELTGFQEHQVGKNGGWKRAQICFNGNLTYEQGRRKNAAFYPELSEAPSFMEQAQKAKEQRPKRKARWFIFNKP